MKHQKKELKSQETYVCSYYKIKRMYFEQTVMTGKDNVHDSRTSNQSSGIIPIVIFTLASYHSLPQFTTENTTHFTTFIHIFKSQESNISFTFSELPISTNHHDLCLVFPHVGSFCGKISRPAVP